MQLGIIRGLLILTIGPLRVHGGTHNNGSAAVFRSDGPDTNSDSPPTSHSQPAWEVTCDTSSQQLVWQPPADRFRVRYGALSQWTGARWTMLRPETISLRLLPENRTINVRRKMAQGGMLSFVYVDEDRTLVLKQNVKFLDAQPLQREVCMLRKLSGLSWAPRLICYHDQSGSLITSHAGTPLGPADLLSVPEPIEQMLGILRDMEHRGLAHNDIVKPNGVEDLRRRATWFRSLSDDALNETVAANRPLGVEVHVKGPGGRLSLLDFGAGTVNGSSACNENITTRSHLLYGSVPDRRSFEIITHVRNALLERVGERLIET